MRALGLVCLLLATGCRSWRGSDVTLGDFFGFNARSREHWRAALDRPARNTVAAGLAASAALLQIGDTDEEWQKKIRDGNWMPGTEQDKGADVGSWLLVGAGLVTPLLIAPHPDRGTPGRRYTLTAAYALGLNLAINQIVKSFNLRERPNGSNFSFYSGHTVAAFTGAQLLRRMYGWEVGVPAYAAATMVGFYRIEADRHWPSDVLFGAAMGIWLTDVIYEKNHGERGLFASRRARISLRPVVEPGRLGAALTWSW